MTAVYCIVWVLIATVTTWGIMTIRSSSAVARLQGAMREEIAYWQAETARARTQAAQIARDTATWATAWRQGRDDAIGIIPQIVSARDSATPGHNGEASPQPTAEDRTEIR